MCKKQASGEPGNGWLFLLLLLLAGWMLGFLLASCSTTSKNKSIVKTSTDSSSTTRIDSSGTNTYDSTHIKKADIVTIKESAGEYEKETTIEFFHPIPNNAVPLPDYITPTDDYFPSRIKSITIKERGKNTARETTTDKGTDSARLVKSDTGAWTKFVQTDLSKTTFLKAKETERTSYWGWLWWLLLLIPAYLCYRYWPQIKTALKLV